MALKHPLRCGLLAVLLLGAAAPASAASGVYLEPEQFLATAFGQSAPTSATLWLSGELRKQVSDVLGHPPTSARQRYWLAGDRSAWVLNEIGKEQPITAGFVVENSRIVSAHVMTFRESRGWEIRQRAFTRQFIGVGLNKLQLTSDIDGITGATLSVRAMQKMAKLALLYHAHIHPGSGVSD